MARTTGRVTAVEVARHSGVSQATVSYVLNGSTSQRISEETRRRVLQSVEELGYRPFQAARTLRSGQSDVVLFVVPGSVVGHVVGELIDVLASLLLERGLTLLVQRMSPSAPLMDVVRAVAPRAVISMVALGPDARAEIEASGARVEVIGFRERGAVPDADVVQPQEHVGRLQAEHLIAQGHRTLAYALPVGDDLAMFAEPRLAGVQRACADAGLEPPLTEVVPLDRDAAADVVRRWRAAGVTGVCAFIDDVAIAVLGGADAAGIAVPGQLSVVGVDDIPLAQLVTPALTSVHLDVDVMASDLVVLAGLGAVSDEGGMTHEQIHLIPRASSASPPGGAADATPPASGQTRA